MECLRHPLIQTRVYLTGSLLSRRLRSSKIETKLEGRARRGACGGHRRFGIAVEQCQRLAPASNRGNKYLHLSTNTCADGEPRIVSRFAAGGRGLTIDLFVQ